MIPCSSRSQASAISRYRLDRPSRRQPALPVTLPRRRSINPKSTVTNCSLAIVVGLKFAAPMAIFSALSPLLLLLSREARILSVTRTPSCGATISIITVRGSRPVTVSYTHLDVYKRQESHHGGKALGNGAAADDRDFLGAYFLHLLGHHLDILVIGQNNDPVRGDPLHRIE